MLAATSFRNELNQIVMSESYLFCRRWMGFGKVMHNEKTIIKSKIMVTIFIHNGNPRKINSKHEFLGRKKGTMNYLICIRYALHILWLPDCCYFLFGHGRLLHCISRLMLSLFTLQKLTEASSWPLLYLLFSYS